jgi:hypothetical protein
MHLKCIACDVLARPVYLCAAHSPHIIDVELVPYGLHTTPNKLREKLQGLIAAAAEQDRYDGVLLAYGLCGKATHGLRAVSLPLVVPRAHDCITLFLGGRDRYDREFQACPGTYWYVQDFIERGDAQDIPLSIGANTAADADALYAEYVQKYGKDNADYLMEVMGAWQGHYTRAAFIQMTAGNGRRTAEQAREDARRRGWTFEQVVGNLVLVKKLLDGVWDEDFLTVAPGESIEMIGGKDIIRRVAPPGND